MIGSACYFSYKEGDSKAPELSSESSGYAVDRKETDIPKSATVTKATTTHKESSYIIITTENPPESSLPEETEIITSMPEEANVVYEIPAEETVAEAEPEKEDAPPVMNQPLKSPLTVINEFSGQELVKNETTGSWQTHNGTDYKAEIGDDVYSVTDGTITAVNNDPLWGTVVIIQAENGDIYRYCNLSKELNVQKGTGISAGDLIGVVGDTADIESAIEPHLHIEVMRGGKYQNPADFIKEQ